MIKNHPDYDSQDAHQVGGGGASRVGANVCHLLHNKRGNLIIFFLRYKDNFLQFRDLTLPGRMLPQQSAACKEVYFSLKSY